MARDPDNLNQIRVRRLADVGLIGEWLDDLPEKSVLMNLTESDWLKASYSWQRETLDSIEEKIRLYQEIHDEPARWVSIDDTQTKGEAVTTVPLDILP